MSEYHQTTQPGLVVEDVTGTVTEELRELIEFNERAESGPSWVIPRALHQKR
jgi:hypothetical protein